MDQSFKFFTDTATLAAFDPRQLDNRIHDDVDWWCSDFAGLPEVRNGQITLVSLGGDGVYQGRITDGDLRDDERDYAAERIGTLGVEVVSGRIFIGPGECLPGGGSRLEPSNGERGIICGVENGHYSVEIFSIQWFDSPRWWSDEHQPPDDAPADYVLILRPCQVPVGPVGVEPRFDGASDDYLFDSSTRQVGPQPGMILTTTVRKGPNGLTLKHCGPLDYRPSLIDYSSVTWKDTIRFRVIAVDHEAEEMTGEFVETATGT